jgi:hydroxymethylbilane synthase
MSVLRLGTRGSALALWQARHVRDRLEAAGHPVEIVEITTTGDRILDVPLAEIGDKALFTRELDDAMLAGHIDLAVHSLKDLPTRLPEGITIAAVSEREEPWDAFVAHPRFVGALENLPRGATLATSSLRRAAQLRAWRSDLNIVPVRGNVDTRLRKLDESDWHGMILAAAGLVRLGLRARIRERLPLTIMVPAISQGALGITAAASAVDTCRLLAEVMGDAETHAATSAERAFLRRLEGGCQAPIGAYASITGGRIRLEGIVSDLKGERTFRGDSEGVPDESEALGTALAERLLEAGAGDVLREIREG